MTQAGYNVNARLAIENLYDDPAMEQLSDRLEALLDLLDNDPSNPVLRRDRMQSPKLWRVNVYGSGREFTFLWDFTDEGQPWVHWAGNAF